MTKASDNVFPRFLISEGGSTSTPSSGRVTMYAKADGLLYSKDDAGTETLVSGGVGGIVPFSGCHVYNSAAQTASPLLFNTEVFDTDTYHSTASVQGRITIPSGKDGYFQFVFTSLANTSEMQFQKNGTTIVAGRVYGLANNYIINVSHPIALVATDYVQCINGGGSFGHASVFDAQSQFSVHRLGS